MVQLTAKLGKKGTLTVPAEIRERIGLVEGSILVFEVREEGLLIRPAITTPVKPEVYSHHRKAEFLLNNAIDEADYAEARREVEAMGLDPDEVAHERPGA